jgi:hypothetical protein
LSALAAVIVNERGEGNLHEGRNSLENEPFHVASRAPRVACDRGGTEAGAAPIDARPRGYGSGIELARKTLKHAKWRTAGAPFR